ncbi:hypothetical protein HBH63_046410 [Parastagonospora nodorum]|nr:hypothetical protein HBH63_046410 [Parastagonospora nodorum]
MPVPTITGETQPPANGMSTEAVITVVGICTALACFIIGLAWPRLRTWLSCHFKKIFTRDRPTDDANWWTSVETDLPRYQDETRRVIREHYPDWVRFNQWVELRRAGSSGL